MADSFGGFQSPGENTFTKLQSNLPCFLFLICLFPASLFNNRKEEKWKRTQLILYPLSYGLKDVNRHEKAVRKEENKVSICHCPGTRHIRGTWDSCWDDLISIPTCPCTFLLGLFQDTTSGSTSFPYISQ